MSTKELKKKPKRKRIQCPFGENLKKEMQSRSLTLKQVATIGGVSIPVVHEWLNGSQPHDLNAVLKICKELKLDFKFMLTGEKSDLRSLDLKEIFHIEDDPTFSGLFLLEAKRLKKKG